jgi:hypothetical protein
MRGMTLLRRSLLAVVLAATPAAAVLAPSDAQASVSIAVGFDALVKDADSVGVATAVESKSVWENGRIYTYTRVRVDQGVAGELGTGAEGWIRTMGGVVGKIGQHVDGEPVFANGKTSLLFMRKLNASGTWEVSARAQGQYPVLLDDTLKTRKLIRSSAVGVLFPPRVTPEASAAAAAGATRPQSASASPAAVDPAKTVRLASEVIHDRPVDDVAREIAASWKTLHPAPAPSDTNK